MRIRQRAQKAADGIWADVAGLSDLELASWLEQITPIVQGARLASATVTTGYLRQIMQLTEGISPDTAGLLVEEVAAGIRNGATIADVYTRPIITARSAIAAGSSWKQAMQAGLERMDTTVATDVQLAMRDTVYEYGRRVPQVHRWRRVLAGGKVCALCVVASTQVYYRGDLMPIHPNCDCGVIPETENFVPDNVNQKRLEDARNFLGRKYSGTMESYRGYDEKGRREPHVATTVHGYVDEHGNVVFHPPENLQDATVLLPDVKVEEHGELGPTLVDGAHHFTGPDEVG